MKRVGNWLFYLVRVMICRGKFQPISRQIQRNIMTYILRLFDRVQSQGKGQVETGQRMVAI